MRTRVNLIDLDVTQVVPNPWNPNRQSDFIYEKEKKSITDHGFFDPILIRRLGGKYQIIDGEHRWRAACDLGFTSIPANDMGEVDDGIAKSLTLVTNGVRGESDPTLLSSLLTDLKATIGWDAMVETLPYPETELKVMLADSEMPWDQAEDTATQASQDAPNSAQAAQDEAADGDWKVVTLQLPRAVAADFRAQIDRVKRLLAPQEDPAHTSPIGAVQAMTRALGSLPDEAFRC